MLSSDIRGVKPELASALATEARDILSDLKLLEELSKYGEAKVVGSVALDLVVKLDIDVHVLTRDRDVSDALFSVAKYLLSLDSVPEVRLTRYPGINAMKVGVDHYAGPSGDWSIDVWIAGSPELVAFDRTNRLLDTITAEQRQVIIRIKSHYNCKGLLRDGTSTLIYEAVCEHGIRGIEEFKLWLSKTVTSSDNSVRL